jgi:hypothetical protein
VIYVVVASRFAHYLAVLFDVLVGPFRLRRMSAFFWPIDQVSRLIDFLAPNSGTIRVGKADERLRQNVVTARKELIGD